MNTNKFNQSKLVGAYKNNNIDEFRRIINNERNIDCNNKPNTSLFELVVNDGFRSVKFFEELVYADCHLKSSINPIILLSNAINYCANHICVEKLLKLNFNINDHAMEMKESTINLQHMTNKYDPVIFSALTYTGTEYIKYLLPYKPDLGICNEYGEPVLIVLLRHYLDTKTNKYYKISDILKELIQYGANINDRCGFGRQPIHLLSSNFSLLGKAENMQDYENLFYILLDNGADLNSKTSWGGTPLTMAIHSGNNIAFNFLIENGANINICDADGVPLLMLAAKENAEFFNILLKNGADPYLIDKNGNNMTHLFFKEDNSLINEKRLIELFMKYPKLFFDKNIEGERSIYNLIKNLQTNQSIDKNDFITRFPTSKKSFFENARKLQTEFLKSFKSFNNTNIKP